MFEIILRLALYFISFAVIFQWLDYLRQKSNLPGPLFPWPFIGALLEMVFDPFTFYAKQAKYGPISCNYIFGRLFVFVRDPELVKSVFQNQDGQLRLYLHLNAEKILGKGNLAFLHGASHKQLRVELLNLFHKQALAKYLHIQSETIRSMLLNAVSFEREIRTFCRDLTMTLSINVFIGKYLTQKEEFSRAYWEMNDGLLALPINLPGTALYRAIRGREKLIEILSDIVIASQHSMASENAEPTCLLDEWMKNVIHVSNHKLLRPEEYAFHLLDFLFASQDASTSSLVWVFHLLSKYPHVHKTIFDEQMKLRDSLSSVTMENISQMNETSKFVMELLRYRPPAISVPHIAIEETKIDKHVIPKGSIIFPSIFAAQLSEEGFPNAETFDPDRFQSVIENANFMAFGKYAHACLGKTYALNQLKAFTAILVRDFAFDRKITPDMEKIAFCPTIIPADNVPIKLHRL